MQIDNSRSLIVTIVRKGWGDRVIQSSREAGAEGATVMLGRGVGIHEHQKIFGLMVEPEKEVILTVVPNDKVDAILASIVKAAELNKPGAGLSFVLPIEKMVGMVHSHPVEK